MINKNRQSFKIKEELLSFLPDDYFEALNKKYLSLNMRELLEDKEFISSIKCYFKNCFNICKTAKEMGLHRNSMTYRIKKVKVFTGLNLMNFEDAILFKIMIETYEGA